MQYCAYFQIYLLTFQFATQVHPNAEKSKKGSLQFARRMCESRQILLFDELASGLKEHLSTFKYSTIYIYQSCKNELLLQKINTPEQQ